MGNYLQILDNFANFVAWIGGSCKPSDKGKLTAFPRFIYCQLNVNKNVSNMLRFEELPEINSERWLSLEDLEGEEWRDVVGYEGLYKVSNYGRIKSLPRFCKNKYNSFFKKEKIKKLSQKNKKEKYWHTGLVREPKTVIIVSVSRVVAMAFHPNTYNKPQVDHINTNRNDNRAENLRWVTKLENANNPLTRQKIKKVSESRKGIPRPQETREKIREKLKNGASSGFWQKGELNVRSKPIIQLTLDGKYIREWPCISQAHSELGGHISCCCRGKRRTAANYKWMFKEDYIKK